jgi:deoxyribonuclease IV
MKPAARVGRKAQESWPSLPAKAVPILGAHMSIAGGYSESVERAYSAGCLCVQLFTKNNNQWRAKEILPEEIDAFQSALSRRKILHPLSHSSYLINIASPQPELWRKSIDALVVEIQRAALLGIPNVVLHPGAHMELEVEAGLRRASAALDEAFAQTKGLRTGILLETTAGQGTCLGHRFEHLASLIHQSHAPGRLGVCFDTCHAFAAGYALGSEAEYAATMDQLDRIVGLHLIRAFHLNDSVKGLGSRVDRHAHIGKGLIGREAFRQLLNDDRFTVIPKYLETPKGEENGRDLDKINLSRLRRMIARPR